MYNFLWKIKGDAHGFHLCNWEQITISNIYGGWGIHNIFDFSKSLALNTLWRVFMGEGIW
jgi:hypothetical protein